jgi:hypothetical protein
VSYVIVGVIRKKNTFAALFQGGTIKETAPEPAKTVKPKPMKRALPLLFSALPFIAQAQLHAGDVPAGSTAMEMDIAMDLPADHSSDEATIDLDCDGLADLKIVLVHGMPEADAPNYAVLRTLDTDLEICRKGTGTSARPAYYLEGEELACTGNFDWRSTPTTVLGVYGTRGATGPFRADSMYIAFSNKDQVGWLELSFRLNSQVPRLRVHRVLTWCNGGAEAPLAPAGVELRVMNSVTGGEPLRIINNEEFIAYELFDLAGKLVATRQAPATELEAPADPGTYIVHGVKADGQRAVAKIIRL